MTTAAAPPQPHTAPTALLLLLASKHDFVRSNLDAGRVPTPQMLASFLQALVTELMPLVKAAPASVGETLKAGLTVIGWVVATNAPAPGSSPPEPAAVLSFLDSALDELMPSVAAARAAAAQASRALAEEERELSLLEEEAGEGSLSGKQQRALQACQVKLPHLRTAAAAAARLAAAVEARMGADDLAAAEAEEEARRGMESLRVAQLTRDAAEAAAGGGGGKGGGRGGGGKGGGGKGGRGGGGSGRRGGGGGGAEPMDREERAAEAAARAAGKAAAEARAAEGVLAELRASDITLVDASELRKGGHVLLPVGGGGREEPCKIVEITTSKTGKHGHAKLSITATDVAAGRKIERNLRADERVTVPGKRWLMAIGSTAAD